MTVSITAKWHVKADTGTYSLGAPLTVLVVTYALII